MAARALSLVIPAAGGLGCFALDTIIEMSAKGGNRFTGIFDGKMSESDVIMMWNLDGFIGRIFGAMFFAALGANTLISEASTVNVIVGTFLALMTGFVLLLRGIKHPRYYVEGMAALSPALLQDLVWIAGAGVFCYALSYIPIFLKLVASASFFLGSYTFVMRLQGYYEDYIKEDVSKFLPLFRRMAKAAIPA